MRVSREKSSYNSNSSFTRNLQKTRGIILHTSLLFSVFNWILEREDSPKCFPLSAEVQWCEAAVVPLMKYPAPRCLQQSPANLHAAPLSCNMEWCRPLLVNCVRITSLKQGSQLCLHYLIECDLSFQALGECDLSFQALICALRRKIVWGLTHQLHLKATLK